MARLPATVQEDHNRASPATRPALSGQPHANSVELKKLGVHRHARLQPTQRDRKLKGGVARDTSPERSP
jgi:hypothetical protein